MNDMLVIVAVYLGVFLASPLIALFHELGHALAYLAFTKSDYVEVYVGSYGNKTKAISFQIGRIQFYIHRAFPFVKGVGLCKSNIQEARYIYKILILLAGPLFSLLVALIFSLIVSNVNASVLVLVFCYIFLAFAVLSLVANLVPRDIETNGNMMLQTDGKQILFALQAKSVLPVYTTAYDYLDKREYDLAVENFKQVIEVTPNAKHIYRTLVVTLIRCKRYDEANSYIDTMETKFGANADILFDKGCIMSLLNRHHEAIEMYQKVLKVNTKHILALNNLGGSLIEQQAYEVAQRVLEKAIKISPGFEYPYATLGYSEIKQGNLQKGKSLVDKCLAINANNPEAYKVMGIYYLKQSDAKAAKENLDKALELNPDIDIEEYLDDLNKLQATLLSGRSNVQA